MSFPLHGYAPPLLTEEDRLVDAIALCEADIANNVYWVRVYTDALEAGEERDEYLAHCNRLIPEHAKRILEYCRIKRRHETRLKELRA